MNIILYGLGSGTSFVEKILTTECKIIGYSDSFYKGKTHNGKCFFMPDELSNQSFDYIIIGIGDDNISEQVENNLIRLGIEKEKIIRFYYSIYKKKNNDVTLFQTFDCNLNRVEYDGIILGISHARCGIRTDCLTGHFFNASWYSQDLFYNFKVLQYIKDNHYDKFRNLKYIIIDMYRYEYFNYDVSLSNEAGRYYLSTGMHKYWTRNFMKNKNFNDDEKREILNSYSNEIDISKYDFIDFTKFYNEYADKKFNLKYTNILDQEHVEEYKKMNKTSGIQRCIYNNTIKDNEKAFKGILDLAKWFNPDIKIYLICIPQSKVVEDYEKENNRYWKTFFYNMLDKYKSKYEFEVLDFKNCEEISNDNNNYCDVYHLNYYGAEKFSRMLDKMISQ